MVAAAYCQLCGKRIAGKSQQFRHPAWQEETALRVCMDCVREKPRCTRCGLPLAVESASGLCTTCQMGDSRPIGLSACKVCGRPVTGMALEFDGVGPYCYDCIHQRPPCDICGAPLTDQRWRLSDGRVVCAYCNDSAVYSVEAAGALLEAMKEIIAQRLGLRLNIPTGLALVDRNQLQEVIRQQTTDNTPEQADEAPELDPERTLGIYARRGMRRGMYVQNGLPKMLFLQVAAHEFGHAWQGENCPILKAPLVHEGFAEWIAFHVVGAYGYRNGQERMIKRKDIYGRGLKWALELEAKQGVCGVIDACRRMV